MKPSTIISLSKTGVVRRRITNSILSSSLSRIGSRASIGPSVLVRRVPFRCSRLFWHLHSVCRGYRRDVTRSMDNIGNRDSRRWKKEGMGYFEGLPVERNSTMDLVKTLRRVLWVGRILGKIIFVPVESFDLKRTWKEYPNEYRIC